MENGLGSVFANNFNKTTSSDYPQAVRIAVLCASVFDIEEGTLPFPIFSEQRSDSRIKMLSLFDKMTLMV